MGVRHASTTNTEFTTSTSDQHGCLGFHDNRLDMPLRGWPVVDRPAPQPGEAAALGGMPRLSVLTRLTGPSAGGATGPCATRSVPAAAGPAAGCPPAYRHRC